MDIPWTEGVVEVGVVRELMDGMMEDMDGNFVKCPRLAVWMCTDGVGPAWEGVIQGLEVGFPVPNDVGGSTQGKPDRGQLLTPPEARCAPSRTGNPSPSKRWGWW